jgi:anaerobic dimethyl sulfoxide reductase subunit B
MSRQLGFHVDTSACVGCKACQIACKDKHRLPVGVLWRKVIDYGGGDWKEKNGTMVPDHVFSYFISLSCNHCTHPACIPACPTEAIYKRPEDGLVLVDEDKCIGCKDCKRACPYDAPQFSAQSPEMTKCTLCVDLIDAGYPPACVEACPMRAIHFGDMEELQAKFGKLRTVAHLPRENQTHPSLVITPHRDAQPSGMETGRILNLEGEI